MFFALAAYLSLCAGLMYVLIMGPSDYHRNGLVGALHRTIQGFPPKLVYAFCLILAFGRRSTAERWTNDFGALCQHRRNPTLPFCYLGIMAASFYTMRQSLSYLEPAFWNWFTLATSCTAMISYAVAVMADPGIVPPHPSVSKRKPSAHSILAQRGKKPHHRSLIVSFFAALTSVVFDKLSRTKASAASKGSNRVPKADGAGHHKHHGKRHHGGTTDGGNPSMSRASSEIVDDATVGHRSSPPHQSSQSSSSSTTASSAIDQAKAKEERQNQRFPSDGALFEENAECYTCLARKPPRSKHCRVCGHCVRRYDHHCSWIGGDVGEGNLRYFHTFLGAHVFICWYTAVRCFIALQFYAEIENLWGGMFQDRAGKYHRAGWRTVTLYIIQRQPYICALFSFAFLVGILLSLFWGSHLRNLFANITSNEKTKLMELRYVLMQEARAEFGCGKPGCECHLSLRARLGKASAAAAGDGSGEKQERGRDAPSKSKDRSVSRSSQQQVNGNAKSAEQSADASVDRDCSLWQKSSRSGSVSAGSDRQKDLGLSGKVLTKAEVEVEIQRLRGIRNGGVIANIREVFFPSSPAAVPVLPVK